MPSRSAATEKTAGEQRWASSSPTPRRVPGELSYASPGSGSVGHLTMALFLARAGLKMEAVLYKGGGPAMADVVAGHVPCYFGN